MLSGSGLLARVERVSSAKLPHGRWHRLEMTDQTKLRAVVLYIHRRIKHVSIVEVIFHERRDKYRKHTHGQSRHVNRHMTCSYCGTHMFIPDEHNGKLSG